MITGNHGQIIIHSSTMGEKPRPVSNIITTRSGKIWLHKETKLIRWPQTQSCNSNLKFQLLLLQESWKELFLLYLAQWSIPWDLSTLLNSSKARDRLPQDEITANEIKTIQELIGRFRQLSPDLSECGCMKAVILFTPGKRARNTSVS